MPLFSVPTFSQHAHSSVAEPRSDTSDISDSDNGSNRHQTLRPAAASPPRAVGRFTHDSRNDPSTTTEWSTVRTVNPATRIAPETFNDAIALLSPEQLFSKVVDASKCRDLSSLAQLIETASPNQLAAAFTNEALSLLEIVNCAHDKPELQHALLSKFDLGFLESLHVVQVTVRWPLLHFAVAHSEYQPTVLEALLTRGLSAENRLNPSSPLCRLGASEGDQFFNLSDSTHKKGELLLKYGADINGNPTDRLTPMALVICRLINNGGYRYGRTLSNEANDRATTPIVQFFLNNGANPFKGEPSAEHHAYRDQWYQVQDPSMRYDLDDYSENTGHIPVQRLLRPYIEHEPEFREFADELPTLIKDVKHSDWYPFSKHLRGYRGLDANQLKLANHLTKAFEGRQDWNEFLVYDLLYSDLRSNPKLQAAPDDFGTDPHDKNSSSLKSSLPFHILEHIQRFVGN